MYALSHQNKAPAFACIHAGPYLIVVTKKKFVGDIDGHSVYEITGTELIPFSKTNIHLSESQVGLSCTWKYMCIAH